MAVSALLPILADTPERESRALLLFASEVQFIASTSSKRGHALLASVAKELRHASSDQTTIDLALQLIGSCRVAYRSAIPATPVEQAALRSWQETELRWPTEAGFTSISNNPATPRELMQSVRMALRCLAPHFPKLFTYAWWSAESGQLSSSTTSKPEYFATAYGPSPTNPDIPETLRETALRNEPGLAFAYRIGQSAHDFRWYASRILEPIARPPIKIKTHSAINASWMMTCLMHEIHISTMALNKHQAAAASRRDFEIGQSRGRESFLSHLAAKSARANEWREIALSRAQKLRQKFPERSLPKIAQAIAGELTLELELENALLPETVYEFIRVADPSLTRTTKGQRIMKAATQHP